MGSRLEEHGPSQPLLNTESLDSSDCDAPKTSDLDVLIQLVSIAGSSSSKARAAADNIDEGNLHDSVSNHIKGEKHERIDDIVKLLAILIFMAPGAAGEILDKLLELKEERQMSLRGYFINNPMKCHFTTKPNMVRVRPKTEELPQNFKEPWLWLLSKSVSLLDRNVYDVVTVEMIVPNIVDVDILWALGFGVRTNDLAIFSKRTVQAVVYCLWDDIMRRVLWIMFALDVVDAVVITWWGLTPAGDWPFARAAWAEPPSGTDRNAFYDQHHLSRESWDDPNGPHIYAFDSSEHAPVAWAILCAGVVRHACDYLWWCWSFRARYEKHTKLSRRNWKSALSNLWSCRAFLQAQTAFGWIHFVTRVAFLCKTIGAGGSVMSSFTQGLLAFNIIISYTSLCYYLCLLANQVGLFLMAIWKTVHDPMLMYWGVLVVLSFLVYLVAFGVVNHEDTLSHVAVYLFRGLAVGDGDGLDIMGLKETETIDHVQEAHKFRTLLGIVGSLASCAVAMNMTIAIVESIYSDNIKKVWLFLHQERAKFCSRAILSLHKFGGLNARVGDWGCAGGGLWASGALIALGVLVGALLSRWESQCTHNLCAHWVLTTFSVVLIVAGEILLEAQPFHSVPEDWFPQGAELEASRCPHYLIFHCRADYNEKVYYGRDAAKEDIDELRKIIQSLEKKVDELRDPRSAAGGRRSAAE